MKRFYFILLCVVVAACIQASSAAAASKKLPVPVEAPAEGSAAALKQACLKLRNTDPRVTREADWDALAAQLADFVSRNPKDPEAGSILFNAAALHESRYGEQRRSEDLDQAVRLFDGVAKRYPQHPFADDALMRQGDLLLYEKHDAAHAAECYRTLLARFKDSDLHSLAGVRLREAQGGAPSKKDETRTALPAPLYTIDGSRPIIMLDPGHGGEDFGASGLGGLVEKDVTLDVALRVEKILTERFGIIVRLTRRRDIFVPLAERTSMANDFDANLFVSLHTNASPERKLSGLETYYLDNTDNHAAKMLAERENSSMRFEGEGASADLQYILSDLIQTGKLKDSMQLARDIQTALVGTISGKWGKVHSFGVRKAPFYVLVGAHMPCILTEMLFIDHPNDGRMLADPSFRQTLAEGIGEGVSRHLAAHSDQTPVERNRKGR